MIHPDDVAEATFKHMDCKSSQLAKRYSFIDSYENFILSELLANDAIETCNAQPQTAVNIA